MKMRERNELLDNARLGFERLINREHRLTNGLEALIAGISFAMDAEDLPDAKTILQRALRMCKGMMSEDATEMFEATGASKHLPPE